MLLVMDTQQCELAGELAYRRYEAIGKWIKSDWPFGSVALPGRGISWDAWRAIQDEPR
jgi:hypothetical protein